MCTPSCDGRRHDRRRHATTSGRGPGAARRRPGAPPDGVPPGPGGRGGPRRRGRGRRRRDRCRDGDGAPARCRADGRPHARVERHRRHPGDRRGAALHTRRDPHDIRPRRVRVRGAAGRRQWVPAQGRAPGRADRRDPRRRERRRRRLAPGDPSDARDVRGTPAAGVGQACDRSPRRPGPAVARPHRARDRGARRARRRALERGDRREVRAGRGDGEDAHRADPREARSA